MEKKSYPIKWFLLHIKALSIRWTGNYESKPYKSNNKKKKKSPSLTAGGNQNLWCHS